MKRLLFFVFLGLLCACNKPDPNPELKDPIYLDLETRIKEVEGQLATEKKNLEDANNELKKAVPQTGQIKFARKHFFDVKARMEKLNQELRYYKSRKETRIYEARNSYMDAFEKKEPWPDPKEFEEYGIAESARKKSRIWSVKERIAKESSSASEKKPVGEGGEGGSEGGHH